MYRYQKELDVLNKFRILDLENRKKNMMIATIFIIPVLVLASFPIIIAILSLVGQFWFLFLAIIIAFTVFIYYIMSHSDIKPALLYTHTINGSFKSKKYLNDGLSHLLLHNNFDTVKELKSGDIPRTCRFLDFLIKDRRSYTDESKFSGRSTHNSYRISTEHEWLLGRDTSKARIGEVKIEEFVKTENSSYWRHFGYFLIVQEKVEHEFEGETLVWSKHFPAKHYKKNQKVTLESKEFRKRYYTYTTNQREARVCLKTNVMTAILDTFKPSWQLFMEFRNQWVIIGMEISKPLFEFDLNKEYTYEDLIKNVDKINYLMDLAETLNINHEYLYKS